jgi:sphingomyelin phosphodiesterase
MTELILSAAQIEDAIFTEILAIANGDLGTNCGKCVGITEVMHIAAITQSVDTITNLLIRSCEYFQYNINAATCYEEYSGIGGTGPYISQLLAKMSHATGDMQAWCHYNFGACDTPPTIQINESQWFGPKPAGGVAPPPSGEVINVLHLTDLHLDPRYDIGSEANCSQYLCCRPYATNTELDTTYANASVPASRWGYIYCDTPADLGISMFMDMPNFINMSNVSFTIFTGDIVTHDNDDQLSQAYVEYEEQIAYQTFKGWLGKIVLFSPLPI